MARSPRCRLLPLTRDRTWVGGKNIMHVRANWKVFKPSGRCRARRICPQHSLLITLGFVVLVVLLAAQGSLAQASHPKAPDYSTTPVGSPHVPSPKKQRKFPPADL